MEGRCYIPQRNSGVTLSVFTVYFWAPLEPFRMSSYLVDYLRFFGFDIPTRRNSFNFFNFHLPCLNAELFITYPHKYLLPRCGSYRNYESRITNQPDAGFIKIETVKMWYG